MRLTTRLCFEWCWKNEIPLKFWGRFDDTIPVSLPILKTFLSRRSPIFTCKLIRRFHAKVIWWHGDGAYVGSANHTGAAWNGNVEAGTFFDEADIAASNMDVELRSFFQRIDEHASPLNDELYKALEERQKELNRINVQDADNRKKILGIASVKAAWVLGVCFYYILGEIALLPFNMPFGISIGTLAFTIVMCVFSGVLAVRRVLSADPAEVF